MTPLAKGDVVKLFRLLVGLYPMSAKTFEQADELTRDTWHSLLADLPKEAVFAAVKKHAALNRFPPTIADLRQSIVYMARPDLAIDAAEAWGMVSRVLSGGCKREDIQALPDLVQQSAKDIGWYNIRTSESPEVVRGQFCKLYERCVERTTREIQSPKGGNNDIGTMLQMLKERAALSQ